MAAQFLNLVEQDKFKLEYKSCTEDSTAAPSIEITWDETEPTLAWWNNMTHKEHVIFIEMILELACARQEEKKVL